jgi:5-methylcytosine-specific restriction endonuclease McrA
MTHDHTLARSRGGSDSIKNVTPMCTTCNTLKSKDEKRNSPIKKLGDKRLGFYTARYLGRIRRIKHG